MIDRTYKSELRRVFLIQDLPEPLTRASSHLQIFDNYIEKTRLRLRSVRVPETKKWSWILEHRFPPDENDLSIWEVAEMFLNEAEYHVFEQFEGREIRKNRYFYELDGKQLELDVFIGKLWGLNTAKVVFDSIEELQNFEIPSFVIMEVTNNRFFINENLIGKDFADVQAEFGKAETLKAKE